MEEARQYSAVAQKVDAEGLGLDVRLRFPLKNQINLDDHWPLESGDALLTFERDGDNVSAIVITIRNLSAEEAPVISTPKETGEIPHISINGKSEGRARRIVARFLDYINLYFAIKVDLRSVDIEYVPATDAERERIDMYGIKLSKEPPISRLPFDILAQAFFASEGDFDPSFVSRMLSSAREALIDEQYIECFRYCFLLIEALYGEGKFQKPDLVRAFCRSAEFRPVIEAMLSEFPSDPLYKSSPGRALVAKYSTPETLMGHLVERRGYYFHGNLKRSDPWHPDKQEEARALAEVCIDLAIGGTHSFSATMFGPEINRRFIDNAKRQGAIMSIEVQYFYMDADGRRLKGKMAMDAPGTTATSDLAVTVNKNFLHWAQTELRRETLVHAVAVDRATGQEIFRSQFLGGEQGLARPSENQSNDG